ncbi:MAG: alpha-L-fucosidase [Bacteroidota bacterium]
MKRIFYILFLPLLACSTSEKEVGDIPPMKVIPSPQQVAYQQMEMVGFIHFTVNTFTNKEWGYGDEDPAIFNPTQLDAEQWAKAAKDGGLKELILTAKHHDGFCLWPSKYTEHSVKNSPYKDGKGNVVKEFVDACRKYGLKVGLYLSPWDRNHKDYGTPAYITYYRNQLRELLTEYGEINEIWFDGANGGDGYYGGANETRKIDRKTYYDWENTIKLVKELQPDIKIFSDAGPDIRWVGNERGYAGETFWSTINTDSVTIGNANTSYLNTGDPNGNKWVLGQCDVSIRPGWFYHADQDSLVKSPEKLLEIYDRSVGRNGVLLLNLPPDQRGLIHENDVKSLKDFKRLIDHMFMMDLASGQVRASNTRMKNKYFDPNNILDQDLNTYWATDDGIKEASLIIELEEEVDFERIIIQEPIRFGQRVSRFQVFVDRNDEWELVFEGTTIGYKRIIETEPINSKRIKLTILDALGPPAISNFEIY